MSETSDILSSAAATAFANHFFELIRSLSQGEWLAYRDIYNRSIAELPDNLFVQWLAVNTARRSKLKSVLERAQLNFPDVERRKAGKAQSAPVSYRSIQAMFEIVTNKRAVSSGFGTWRRAMMTGSRGERGLWETPEGLLAATFPRPSPRLLGQRVALGFDASGRSWTLQINQPTKPKTHDVHSALAKSPDGRPALLRQGTLQRSTRNPVAITEEEFRLATGLDPLDVLHNGVVSPRKWYRVAWLDESSDDIRKATARFAEACEAARVLGSDAHGAEDEARLDELFGSDEDDGSHTVPGKTTEDLEITHIQGAVSRRLKAMLKVIGVQMTKPRHRAGYEVDGLISVKPVPILLEIKTSSGASSTQTGIGQLTLYPRLIPRLKNARRMLLTRGKPGEALAKAIRDSHVELHSYDVTIKDARVIDVRFDPGFLKALGIE